MSGRNVWVCSREGGKRERGGVVWQRSSDEDPFYFVSRTPCSKKGYLHLTLQSSVRQSRVPKASESRKQLFAHLERNRLRSANHCICLKGCVNELNCEKRAPTRDSVRAESSVLHWDVCNDGFIAAAAMSAFGMHHFFCVCALSEVDFEWYMQFGACALGFGSMSGS